MTASPNGAALPAHSPAESLRRSGEEEVTPGTFKQESKHNLRTDPFERADITSNTYYDWFLDHDYIVFAAQTIAAEFAATFKDFPPRQKAASFTIDQALAKMNEVAGGAGR